jgi:hypothetical protein
MKLCWIPFFLLLSMFLSGCGSPKPWYAPAVQEKGMDWSPIVAESDDFVLFLVGDCGKLPADEPSLPFQFLEQELRQAGPKSCIAYLGDNVYEYGLPPQDNPQRKEMERRLMAQIAPLKDFKGKVLMIPGNHDWAQGKKNGLENRLEEEKFWESQLGQNPMAYLPDHGCPGPAELELAPNLVLIILDSQWWLHKHEKPGRADGCSAGTDETLLEAYRDALARNKGKNIVVMEHHPLHSYGAHGGHYHPSSHLFPLRMFESKAWIPLPVLGSLAVLYRKYHGNIQDIPHPRYQKWLKALEEVNAAHPNLVFATGHDHNLQYLPKEGRHYVVSGSGSKSTYVSHGKKAHFTDAERGFAKLIYKSEGSVWLEFHAEDKRSEKMVLRFQSRLY